MDFLNNTEASDQEILSATGDSNDYLYSGVPSYMVGADSHNLGNQQGSILDPTTWPDRAGNAVKFTLSATARAVTSTWNIVPTVGNWFGGDFEKVDTGDLLRNFDDDLGAYYDANRSTVDVVGDIAASIVPGLAGVKVLNWGQKALALAADGRAGLNMAYKFGTLPDRAQKFADLAAQQMAQSTQQFSWINGNVIKSLAAGYGQSALEGAAFEIAASTAMSSSPLFEKHDVSDVLYNSLLGGGLLGGAIMGSLTAASTYGTIKKAIIGIDKALNPARTTTELAAGAAASERILAYNDDLHTVLAKPAEVSDDAWAKTLQRREMITNNAIRDQSHVLAGKDTELGNIFADNLRGIEPDQMYQNMMGVEGIARVGKDFGKADLSAQQIGALRQDLIDSGADPASKKFQAQLNRYIRQATAVNGEVKYLRISGEDAGTVFQDLPEAGFSFADQFKNADEVKGAIAGKKFSQVDDWNPAAVSAQDAEARYIWARTQNLADDGSATIRANDLPLLERAYEQNLGVFNIKASDGTITQFAGSKGDLLNLIEDTKLSLAQKMLDSSVDVEGLSTAELARKLNTSVKYLEGEHSTVNRAGDLFAMQSAADDYTQRMIQAGQWKADKGIIPTWLQPQHVALKYNRGLTTDINGFELDALSYIKGRQKVYEMGMNNVHANYLGLYDGNLVSQFPEIAGKDLNKADRYGSAAGMVTTANGAYGSLTSTVQAIGNATHQLLNKIKQEVSERFGVHGMQISDSPAAQLELATIRQQLLQTPEKYIIRGGSLVNVKQAKYEDAMAAGAKNVAQPVFEDAAAPVRIPLKTQEMQDFLNDWVAHNDEKYLTPQMTLRNQQGLPVQDRRGIVYFPGVNPQEMKFHAFVVDPSVTATGQSKMIWARSQNELEELARKVPSELRVVYKGDTEEYFKAMRQYDYNAGINQNYMDNALKRSGVAAPFFPQTDGTKIIQDLLNWRADADSYLARDVISGKYSSAFKTLERMDSQFTAAGTSQAQGKFATLREAKNSPFKSYINTALDLREGGAHPIWTGINNMVETAFAKLGASVEDIWQNPKSKDQLDEINAAFKQAGIQTVPYDAALDLLANHSAPKPILSNFIRKANSIVSTFMLRADPLNAVNNGIGANVLLGSETSALVRAIKEGNADAAGELAALANVKIPGVDASDMLSPSKLIAQSYRNYFATVFGGDKAAKEFYQRNGWLSTISNQFKDSIDNLALAGSESASDISKRLSKAGEIAKNLGAKAEKYTGNAFAEEMNRFVAADVAKQISDLGVKYGVITPEQQLSYINTFINRTQGNFLASQRPALFQGPVGQAVGLFQTYQFNMLQQIFRHVSEGSKKDAAILLGLQGSIYGMNGLPAFNAINNHIVGMAAGNTNNRDIISTTYDVAGKEAGDWLLYGFASNMFLHPDLKMNLYSRGDINPRQVTVIPTNVADVPIVGFATKFFGALQGIAKNVGNGADIWPTLMQGIEHAGISRPLAGLAQVGEAFGSPNGKSYSTTSKGDMVMQNDLFSLANLTRLVGGKPLDEAISRDAVFRVQQYQSNRAAQLDNLGKAVKTTILAGGVPSQDQINDFAGKYAEAGGKQQNFGGWMHRLILNTNKSQANAIAGNLRNPYSTYMQSIMGGYQLDDAAP